MRKKAFLFFIVCMLLVFCGCAEKKQEETKLLPVSEEKFYYEGTEEADCFAVDEQGLLYTMTYLYTKGGQMLSEAEMESMKPRQKICIFDLDGNCLEQQELYFGNGVAQAMFVKEGIIYCVLGESIWNYNNRILFAVDSATWEVSAVAELSEYDMVSYMVGLGDCLYFLGTYKENHVDTEDETAYAYRKNKVSRLFMEEGEAKLEAMNLDYPVSIYGTTKDTLVIYQYVEEKGYVFLEFDPFEMTISEIGSQKTDAGLWHMGGCGDGYLCVQTEDMIEYHLFYGTPDGAETQISQENIFLMSSAVYRDGFAFFQNYDGKGGVERICAENIVKDNQAIRLLTLENAKEYPFGCGYLIEKQVLERQDFSLKVLAQDKDFDLLFLTTREPISYNIMQNGAFLDLKAVEGVQEYLDACFPYIKEVATNENGEIWMIPVSISIPCLLYNRGICEENGVDFSQMDFAEFLEFTRQVKATDTSLLETRASLSQLAMLEQFFGQYLNHYATFDTELLKGYAKQIRKINEEQEEWFFGEAPILIKEGKGIPDFFYSYEIYLHDLLEMARILEDTEEIGITSVPKLEEGMGNVGNIVFLAVNPASENLEATLEYISAIAKHMLTQKDTFLLADESAYTDSSFVRDYYEVSKNGEIFFQMDKTVYWNTFKEYIDGRMELEEAVDEMERKRKIYVGE